MKEELKAWKQQNGNVTYTTKELIQGVHIKVDALDKKMANQIEYCTKTFVSKTTFWSVIALITSGIAAGLTAIIGFFKG